jgi:hypothetical protein
VSINYADQLLSAMRQQFGGHLELRPASACQKQTAECQKPE